MSQVFRFAVTDGLILRSPVTGIKIPAKPRSKKRALTDTEKAAVRDAKLDPEERAYLDVLFYLGLRREEALAF